MNHSCCLLVEWQVMLSSAELAGSNCWMASLSWKDRHFLSRIRPPFLSHLHQVVFSCMIFFFFFACCRMALAWRKFCTNKTAWTQSNQFHIFFAIFDFLKKKGKNLTWSFSCLNYRCSRLHPKRNEDLQTQKITQLRLQTATRLKVRVAWLCKIVIV